MHPVFTHYDMNIWIAEKNHPGCKYEKKFFFNFNIK